MNRRDALAILGSSAAGLAAFGSLAAAPVHAEGHEGHPGDLATCARVCADCTLECSRAFKHCLTQAAAGKKEYTRCLERCADCNELCSACAVLCGRESPSLHYSCEACAKCCDECAAACEKSPDDKHMAACAKSCRDCAKECREMLKHLGK